MRFRVTWEIDSFLEMVAELRHILRVLNVDLQKPGLLVRVVHDGHLLADVNLNHSA
jgi:hypothetical protein